MWGICHASFAKNLRDKSGRALKDRNWLSWGDPCLLSSTPWPLVDVRHVARPRDPCAVAYYGPSMREVFVLCKHREAAMSLPSAPMGPIPAETIRIARAAFPM